MPKSLSVTIPLESGVQEAFIMPETPSLMRHFHSASSTENTCTAFRENMAHMMYAESGENSHFSILSMHG